jgi:hypothetical protein
VIVNMERWRWLPRQLGAPSLGNAYVILNIPDYTLKVMQNGAPVWNTKVVTGKPGIHATPLLTETMKFITVNPTWNVPPSIIYNEYLPALQQDPTVLDRMGLKLERARDGSIHISQPPGEANALGRIRFNFPNKFLVYQHDTPDKHLFAKEERPFSHGCMRVQNPDQYAATLLNITMPNEHYTPDKIRGMYGRSEIDIKFPTPIPVNITYQTAFVDDAGSCRCARMSTAATQPCWRCFATPEARIWKAWSHTPSQATAGRTATCRQASTLPATTRFPPDLRFLPDLRSSSGCSEGRRLRPRCRAVEYRNGGCSTADFLPRPTSGPNSPA